MDHQEKPLTPEQAAREERLHELREEMTCTRTALTDKLRTIEERMQHTVGVAQDAVETTVHTVQDGVESVVQMFNLKRHTQEQPWLMLGAALATGAALGYWTSAPKRRPQALVGEAAPLPPQRSGPVAPTPPQALDPVVAPTRQQVDEPARLASPAKRGFFADELDKVKGLAIGAGMALVRDWVKEAAPGIADKIDELFHSATSKLGGEPVQGPVFADEPVTHATRRRF